MSDPYHSKEMDLAHMFKYTELNIQIYNIEFANLQNKIYKSTKLNIQIYRIQYANLRNSICKAA